MKRHNITGWAAMAIFVVIGSVSSMALAQGAAETARAPAPAPAANAPAPDINPPEVKPAGPGVFTSTKQGAQIHLVVKGHTFTSRADIENYLAYRAAELTMEQGNNWFTFVEHRAKGDKVPVPKPDPAGLRYSFRMDFFRPTWRYKTAGSADWKTWSPFSDTPFWATGVDPKTVTDFEVSADIVPHKGMLQDDYALAFDASAVSDYLINQVAPLQ